uniref:Uncharacterized protein n=1 Tax=Cucumis melo TaxID=3656 RepID=A0A9I9EBF9_CUCME
MTYSSACPSLPTSRKTTVDVRGEIGGHENIVVPVDMVLLDVGCFQFPSVELKFGWLREKCGDLVGVNKESFMRFGEREGGALGPVHKKKKREEQLKSFLKP